MENRCTNVEERNSAGRLQHLRYLEDFGNSLGLMDLREIIYNDNLCFGDELRKTFTRKLALIN